MQVMTSCRSCWPRIGVKRVIGREQRRLRSRGDLFQSYKTPPVVAAPRHGRAEPDVALRKIAQTRERRRQARQIARRQDDQQQIAGGLREIVDIKMAFAFLGAQIPRRQQPREPRPAVAILRMNDDVGRLVGEDEPRADDELEGLGALCIKPREKRRVVVSRRIAQFFA